MEASLQDLPSRNDKRVALNWEKSLYILLIILALVTRLWALGDRVQSHDESIHTKYSWNLYAGHGFEHNPLMHGPFLFHVTALCYFLLGDDDFTARIPVALIGVLIVAFPYLLRRWLGRSGALATSFFLLISPSIAYYSRYIRHDIPIMLWSLGVVLAMLSYLRDGRKRWFYLMAAGVSLMFATKEVAFIYNAIFGFFLILLFVVQAWDRPWVNENLKKWFLGAIALVIVGLLAVGLGLIVKHRLQAPMLSPWTLLAGGLAVLGFLVAAILLALGHLEKIPQVSTLFLVLVITALVVGMLFRVGLPLAVPWFSCAQQTPRPQILEGMTAAEREAVLQQYNQERHLCFQQSRQSFQWPVGKYLFAGTPLGGGLGIYFDMRAMLTILPMLSILGIGSAWLIIPLFQKYRAFELALLLGTLCLPFLSPLLIQPAGVDPIDYNMPAVYYSLAIALQVLLVAIAIGLLWDQHRQADKRGAYDWLIAAGIFGAIFILLFTTVLTNGYGVASGLVGSLGYWLKQQAVERGGQPWYYYLLVMVPLYEFLPFLLALAAPLYLLVRNIALPRLHPGISRLSETPALKEHFLSFTMWWIVLGWAAYSYAGEKMPWLTVHLALPMILLSGWLIGRLIEWVDWRQILRQRAWMLALFAPLCVVSLALLIQAIDRGIDLEAHDLASLQASGRFLNGLLGLVAFGAAIYWVCRRSTGRVVVQVLLVVVLLLPIFLTIRTAWRFCYITDEYPTEFLVYAHAAPGVREAMDQIDELSRRVAGGPQMIKVAYGSDGSTLFLWQLRDYPNTVFYGERPSREQLDAPVIIAGRDQWDEVAPYVGDDYIVNTYTFLWWPMQDYWYLTWERLRYAITNPDMRAAIWDVWYDRDYSRYDELTGKRHSIDAWVLRNEFRLYIRRDVAAQMWDLGGTTTSGEQVVFPSDPYAEGWRDLGARLAFGSAGSAPGQFQDPHGIEVGPDGFVYVVDAGNHRIQKFTSDGAFVDAWGTECSLYYQDATTCVAAEGVEFYDPWDIAVSEEGSIYVADTWNHRIQELDADGNPVAAWGFLGEYGVVDPSGFGAFYGPRGLAIGPDGMIYVTDTGNKRIQVFYPNGDFAFQWGGGGVVEGYLDEPVGIALGPDNAVYVADTWNQRVQVFDLYGQFQRQWPIYGWDTGHGEEKPCLAVDSAGYVYVTDPGHSRVLVFDSTGNYILSFGQFGIDEHSIVFPLGIAIGNDDSIYVVDAQNNRVLVFDPLVLPES